MGSNYKFVGDSAIKHLNIEKMPSGRLQAVVIPNALDESSRAYSQLRQLPTLLAENAIHKAYPDIRDGENVLVIPNIKSEKHILKTLENIGVASQVHEKSGQEEDFNLFDDFQKNRLRYAGYVGLPGHIAIATDGVLKGDFSLVAGAMGASNPIIMSLYGNGQQESRFEHIIDEMRDYFVEEGIDIPEDTAVKPELNVFQQIERFISENPQQVGFGLGNIGALGLLFSGMKEFSQTGEWNTLAIASTSVLGNAVVMGVPERKHREGDKKSNNPITSFFNFIQESPLRFNGMLNATDNLFWGIKAYKQLFKQDEIITSMRDNLTTLNASINGSVANIQENASNYTTIPADADFMKGHAKLQKDIDARDSLARDIKHLETKGRISAVLITITAISFGLSTFLAATSSKNKTEEETRANFDHLYAASAKLLVQMEPSVREEVINQMSTFLSLQDELQQMQVSSDEVCQALTERINTMKDSLWVESYEKRNGMETAPYASNLIRTGQSQLDGTLTPMQRQEAII